MGIGNEKPVAFSGKSGFLRFDTETPFCNNFVPDRARRRMEVRNTDPTRRTLHP
jgi:hypothetical protein